MVSTKPETMTAMLTMTILMSIDDDDDDVDDIEVATDYDADDFVFTLSPSNDFEDHFCRS